VRGGGCWVVWGGGGGGEGVCRGNIVIGRRA